MIHSDETIGVHSEIHGAQEPGRARSKARTGLRLPEFRRERRREFRYLLSIALAVALSWIAWLMPVGLRNWIADSGGVLYFRLSKTYRDNVCANLAQVLDRDVLSPEVHQAARRIFMTSGRNFADLLLFPHTPRKRFIDDIDLIEGDWSLLDNVLVQGKGAIVITAHLGAFDVLGQTLNAKGYKVTTVTGRTTARFLFDAVTYLRQTRGATLVEATPSGVRRVIQALRRGECAAFLTDRDFFQNGRPVSFFGRQTTLPPGPVRIARDTGAPIVPIFSVRTENGYGIKICPPFRVPKTGDIDADLGDGLQRVVTVLEEAIGGMPDQWVMFQRVWPLEPTDPVRVFPIGSPLEGEFLERVDSVLPGGPRERSSHSSRRAAPPTDHTEAPRQPRP